MRRAADFEDTVVGAVIRLRRRTTDLSMADMAQILGCSHQQVQKYETGINRVAVVTLLRIAAALRIEPTELFGEIVGKLADEMPQHEAAE